MNAARDEILTRVRTALAGRAEADPLVRDYRRAGTRDASSRVALFAERVADYRADVRRVASTDVRAAIAQVATEGPLGVPEGLPPEWRPERAVVDQGLSPAELDALGGVVGGCTVAIAETGTIVLAGRAHEGRRALTLVPDLHVCIVEADQIVETVPEAFERLAPYATRPLTFVSGPSATSDIELRRVEGVHGPRELVVLIVEGGEGSV